MLLENRTSVLIAVLFSLFQTASPLAAQTRQFLEVSRHTIDIDSEFDDSIVLTSSTLVFNIPALEKVEGLGLAFGWMSTDNAVAISLSHVRANPRATSVFGDTTTALRQYGFDIIGYPFARKGKFSIGPLIRFGTALTTLKIPGSVTDGTSIGDASYRVLGFNVGFGGIVRIANALHVTADYTRHYTKFRTAHGLDESLTIEGGLSATSDVLRIGVGVYFPRGRRNDGKDVSRKISAQD